MFAGGAGVSPNALRLGTLAHRPGIAGFEDAARVAGQAKEVGESPRVGVREAGLKVDDVLDVLVEVELAKGGGGREEGGSGRMVARVLSSDSYT
jgi:hypothetical protein